MTPFDAGRLKAVLLDVDGTLYRQGPVRRGMLWRLLSGHARQPGRGLQTLRALRAYRRAQEALRNGRAIDGDLAAAQLQLVCTWTGISADFVRECVTRWMEHEPLDLVARSARAGVAEFLREATSRGVRLAAVSDYPVAAKLTALGAAPFFAVQVCAQDPDVQSFKPHPRGLLVALQRLGVANHEALYVGDRPEVDAVAAMQAGVTCAIIGRRNGAAGRGWFGVAGYQELLHVIRGRADY